MLVAVLGAAGVALFFGTVGSATPRLSDMNGLGMISILPATTVAGIALLGLAFVLALGMSRPRPLLLGALVAAIVICLDGVTVVLEQDPRFPTAYWIAGFVDYIYRTGHSSPALSAYFSWPGFFEVVAFIEHVVGSTNLMPVLKFWPVTIDLLSLVPMGLIVKRLHATWRAKWLALFIFTVGNWVGQDYFSPQSFNYLLYLFFLALLITYFGKQATNGTPGSGPAGHRQASPPRRFQLSGLTRKFTPAVLQRFRLDHPLPGDMPAVTASRGQRVAVAGAIVAIVAFSTVSHQLTPFFMVVACAVLVLIRRCQLRTLPILLAVIFAAWVSFGASGFWSGHINDMFGGLGDLGSNLSTSVSGRTTGNSSLHKYVLYSRDLFAATVLLMAGLRAAAPPAPAGRRPGARGPHGRAVPGLRAAELRRRDGPARLPVRAPGRGGAGRHGVLPGPGPRLAALADPARGGGGRHRGHRDLLRAPVRQRGVRAHARG